MKTHRSTCRPQISWEKLATSVFTHSHDGIIVSDPLGEILEVNLAFTKATGYSRDEVLGKNLCFLQSDIHSTEFYAELWSVLRANRYWRGEISRRRKDGRIVTGLFAICAVDAEDGQLSHYIGVFSDITALKDKQRQLERLVHFDSLTGLPNRALLMDRLHQTLAWAERHHGQVAVCYLDLDGFKGVNDAQGHHAGDKVLIEIAKRLSSEIRCGDTVARLGGDEFVLLLVVDPNTMDDVGVILERVLASVSKPIGDTPSMIVSASIGVTIFPSDHSPPDVLLRHADQAMYQAKGSGRATYRTFDNALRLPCQ